MLVIYYNSQAAFVRRGKGVAIRYGVGFLGGVIMICFRLETETGFENNLKRSGMFLHKGEKLLQIFPKMNGKQIEKYEFVL